MKRKTVRVLAGLAVAILYVTLLSCATLFPPPSQSQTEEQRTYNPNQTSPAPGY